MRILVRKFNQKNLSRNLNNFVLKVLIVVSLLATPTYGIAQNGPVIISRMNFETGMPQNRTMIGKFKSFSTKINPSIYVENNQIKSSQPNPVSVYSDRASLSGIHNLIVNKSTIEYVSIKINQLSDINNFISLSRFSNFTNLKFIHIIFEFEISNSEMTNLIMNAPSNSYVIYESRKIM